MILFDRAADHRYVVELMLGALDPQHIVRTIEYWDEERRRYPAYDYTAIIVAEEMTSRYLNVLSLMAGNIPLLALQLDVLEVEGKHLLHFTKVLDLRRLRRDDESESSGGGGSSREVWLEYAGQANITLLDRMLSTLKAKVPNLEPSYLKQYIGLRHDNSPANFVTFAPLKRAVWVHILNLPLTDEVVARLQEAGIETRPHYSGFKFQVQASDFGSMSNVVLSILDEAATEFLRS